MTYLGHFATGATLYHYFLTVSSSGEPSQSTSLTITNFRDNSTAGSTAGVTLTTPFAGSTGGAMLEIAMTSTFYSSGDYYAKVTAGTVDSRQLTGYRVASWSIRHSNRISNVNMWSGSTVASPSVAGVPEVDVNYWAGSTVGGLSSGAVPTNVQQVNGSTIGSTGTIIGVSTGATITSVESVTSGVNVNRIHGSTLGSTDMLVSARLTGTGVDDIWDEIIDGTSMTGRRSMRLQNAAAGGLSSGAGTSAFTIRDIDNTANRVVATVSTGNRTAVTLNVSS